MPHWGKLKATRTKYAGCYDDVAGTSGYTYHHGYKAVTCCKFGGFLYQHRSGDFDPAYSKITAYMHIYIYIYMYVYTYM